MLVTPVGINWYDAANVPAANNGSAWINTSLFFAKTPNGWITSMWALKTFIIFSLKPAHFALEIDFQCRRYF
jgi:hypothetical protein